MIEFKNVCQAYLDQAAGHMKDDELALVQRIIRSLYCFLWAEGRLTATHSDGHPNDTDPFVLLAGRIEQYLSCYVTAQGQFSMPEISKLADILLDFGQWLQAHKKFAPVRLEKYQRKIDEIMPEAVEMHRSMVILRFWCLFEDDLLTAEGGAVMKEHCDRAQLDHPARALLKKAVDEVHEGKHLPKPGQEGLNDDDDEPKLKLHKEDGSVVDAAEVLAEDGIDGDFDQFLAMEQEDDELDDVDDDFDEEMFGPEDLIDEFYYDIVAVKGNKLTLESMVLQPETRLVVYMPPILAKLLKQGWCLKCELEHTELPDTYAILDLMNLTADYWPGYDEIDDFEFDPNDDWLSDQ